ncbi:MAG: multicopper oxidase domain-containing protein [Spirochaetaceae bacterium]
MIIYPKKSRQPCFLLLSIFLFLSTIVSVSGTGSSEGRSSEGEFSESQSPTEETAEESRREGFNTPLPIPPLLEASRQNGVTQFELLVQRGSREFFSGAVTPTLGYNGDYLGPTIRVRRGDSVCIDVDNRLNEPTTVHWHGAHVPAKMDGGPHQQVAAGATWRAEFPIDQQAATLWYHPHLIPTTAEQVYRGLASPTSRSISFSRLVR